MGSAAGGFRGFDAPAAEGVHGHRAADVIALSLVAVEAAKGVEGRGVFHAFGDHGQAQVVREIDGRKPRAESRLSVASARGVSSMIALSVISRQKPEVGAP